MRIGDRILRKSTLESGYIIQANKQPSGVYMVRVDWESSSPSWLPSEEVRPWDKLPPPPPQAPTQRKVFVKIPWSKEMQKRHNAQKLADRLVALSDKRKNRSKQKSKKWINGYKKRAKIKNPW